MYSRREYWEDRYSTGVLGACATKGVLSNEWYLEYPALQAVLKQYVAKTADVLVLGCGLSRLAEDMAADECQSIIAVDYSETCIQRMRCEAQRVRRQESAVKYLVMDVTALQLQDSTFDVVVDKATLDCLMNCDDWQAHVRSMLQEAQRVLRVTGRFICVSHSEPEDRVHVLTMQGLLWQLLKVEQLPKNKLMFYAYIFEKVA